MQSPLVGALGVSPFSTGPYPSTIMIIYTVLYVFGAFFLAVRVFLKRDL